MKVYFDAPCPHAMISGAPMFKDNTQYMTSYDFRFTYSDGLQ